MTASQLTYLRPVMLNYDIPEGTGVRNPSYRLYEVGIRLQLSCWILPESDIPKALFHQMAERVWSLDRINPRTGRRMEFQWDYAPFDPAAAGSLLRMAQRSLEEQVHAAKMRAQASYEAALARLDEQEEEARANGTPMSVPERKKAERALRRAANVNVKKNEKLFKRLRETGARFGIDTSGIGAESAFAAIQAAGAAVKERCRVFAEATKELERLDPNNLVAKAARRDQAPEWVLFDALDEAGGNALPYRAAFNPDQTAYQSSAQPE
jgi:hypothetical protein